MPLEQIEKGMKFDMKNKKIITVILIVVLIIVVGVVVAYKLI